MLYTKILVPFDGSEHALDALKYAKELAKLSPEATVDVVQVFSTGMIANEGDRVLGQFNYEQYKELLDAATAGAKGALVESLGGKLDELGERATVDVIPGASPAATLAAYAQKSGCDLIVMGRRGLGAVRGMLGSVSYALLRESEVPVLTVK